MVDPNSGCHLWTGTYNTLGYGYFRIRGVGPSLAHRHSWIFHNGPIPDGMDVCHKCDIPACVNPDHLFLGTRADNNTDKMNKMRHYYGERHNRAKLKDAYIPDIIASTEPVRVLAGKYGVSGTQIRLVKRRKVWRHVATSGAN